jgi:hypothetical protein
MYLPNKIDSKSWEIETIYPNTVKKTKNYVILEESDKLEKKVLSKVWINSTRVFNDYRSNYKTYVSISDDLRYWSDWKEFNEEFDLCEYGKFFKIKTVVFVIGDSNSKIEEIIFAFEDIDVAKREKGNEIVYYSPNSELKKETLYMMRVKSYNGVNYSEWSNLECYMTNNEELGEKANNLRVGGKKNRQVQNIKFTWNGEQDVLSYDNITVVNIESGVVKNGEDLIKGKEYNWRVNSETSKNNKNTFAMNIKPPSPTFD